MAERRPPYAPEYWRPHWSVVGLAPYRGVAKDGDITGCRGDACVAPTASFRARLELSFCGADSQVRAAGQAGRESKPDKTETRGEEESDGRQA